MKFRTIIFLGAFCSLLIMNAKTITDNRTKVLLETGKGKITLALYDETPLHKENFIKLVNEHYFDGMLFHRVIKNFMVQTGDPKSRNANADTRLGDGGPDYTIPAEIRFPQLFHKRGALAAARKGDQVNPQRQSSGSQFYIVWGQDFSSDELNEMTRMIESRSRGMIKFTDEVKKAYLKHGGTPHLDGSYTVFGEIIDGLKVVDRIQQVRTDRNDRPFDDIHIIKAEVLK